VFVTLLAGNELGLTPMASLRAIHVVKGKPILSADTMVAVVLSSGAAEYFMCMAESNDSVTYETKRRSAPKPQSLTWTIEDAKAAGVLGNDNWKKYPRNMLKARCKSNLARDVYPDVLAGCYEENEADEIKDANPERGPVPLPLTRQQAATAIDAAAVERERAPIAATAAAETSKAKPEDKGAVDSWPAFLADLEPLVGEDTSPWDVEAVLGALGRELAACQSVRECNDRMRPFIAALAKHGSVEGSPVAKLKDAFRIAYGNRNDELRRNGAQPGASA